MEKKEDENNFVDSRLKLSRWERFKRYSKALKPILLSHHPNCPEYDGHTLNIGQNRFCIGCFVGYPAGIIGLFVIPLSGLLQLLTSTMVLIISMALLSSIVLSLVKLTEIKIIKIIQKFLIGLGGAFLFWYIWTLPNPFLLNFVWFFIIFTALTGGLNVLHAYGFYSTCKKCSYEGRWETCPGFGALNARLEAEGLPHLFVFRKRRKVEDTPPFAMDSPSPAELDEE